MQASSDEDGRLRTVHPSTCPCGQRTKNWAVHLMDRFEHWTKIIVWRWTSGRIFDDRPSTPWTDLDDGPLKYENVDGGGQVDRQTKIRPWTPGSIIVQGVKQQSKIFVRMGKRHFNQDFIESIKSKQDEMQINMGSNIALIFTQYIICHTFIFILLIINGLLWLLFNFSHPQPHFTGYKVTWNNGRVYFLLNAPKRPKMAPKLIRH